MVNSEYKKYCLNVKQIREIKKNLIIFGAGADGSRLYKATAASNEIAYFVDNGHFLSNSLYGITIIKFGQLKEICVDEIIIIASMYYYREIFEQLIKGGFKPGKDFFIWNGITDGEVNDYSDENTQRFIAYNRKIWSNVCKKNRSNKILIPYRNTTEIVYAPWSYCANYLAEKYDASIYCIGGVRDILNDDLMKLYESFNTEGFINEELNAELKDEADKLFEEVLPTIHEKKDVKKIKIYGENFGTEILRDYLRLEYPILYINDISFERQLKQMIGYIVFWHDYLKKEASNVKAIIVWDGLYYREGIIRKIAYSYGIPVYTIVNTTCFKWNYDVEFDFEYYAKYFDMLTEDEKQKGIKWAKGKLKSHLEGNTEDMPIFNKSVFGERFVRKVTIENSNKIKVVICPHYTEDDAFPYGDDMLFDDPWDWLEYLGKLSNDLPYDWYLKPHPIEKELGDKLINDYILKYPNIKLLPKFVSPVQLKEEGIKYALTIHGSIGYEYPLIGINVINAGYNPHISFDFDINPCSLDEYYSILSNLNFYHHEVDIEQIFKFYCIHFAYNRPRKPDIRSIIFMDDRLKDIRGLISSKTNSSTELFSIYVNEMSNKRHEELLTRYATLFEEMDSYKKGVLRKGTLPEIENFV